MPIVKHITTVKKPKPNKVIGKPAVSKPKSK